MTKITRAPCRRRNGGAVPRAENFGDLITADHKVLSEGCESRNNHRYEIVVQDLATQWIQSYPCKTKTSQETRRSLQKILEPNRRYIVENNLRHSAKGSNDGYDVTFSLTGYEPNDTVSNDTVSNELFDSQGPFSYVTPSSDQDIDDTTLGKYADYRSLEGVFVSVASDRTGKPVGKSNIDQFSFGVRNTYSAHNQFPAITQAEKMVDRTGKPVGEISSSAQIRTLFDEHRQMIIAECCEKIFHHELQAARAEQDRQILQEELWRQQKDFREVHQQNLTEMKELRKFQSSTFDTHAKLIEDQNTIMELSGRLQELQNEVNCMNDSKDFQDAESVRSGNSHVTSQPMLFPKHPIPEGLLRPLFVSPRRKEGLPDIWDTPGISGNVFLQIHMLPLQLLILKN